MAAKVLRIHVTHRDGVLDTVAGLNDAGAEFGRRLGPLATAVRALRRAVRNEEDLAGLIDEELRRLEEADGVELEHWDAEWPFDLELRVDLDAALGSRRDARFAGGALDRLLAMLAELEGSDVSVRLGRGAIDVASARREIAGRAALEGVVLPTVEVPSSRGADEDEEDDEAEYEEEERRDDDELDDADGDDEEEEDDDDDGFPAGGFGVRRPAALDPDESWVISRAALRWPCTADALRRAVRVIFVELHPDRHGGSREAHEHFLRAQRGYELLRERVADPGARDAS